MSVILKSPLSVITVISVTTGDLRSPLESPLNHLYITIHSAVKRLFIWRLYPFITRFYLLKGVYLVFIVNSVF